MSRNLFMQNKAFLWIAVLALLVSALSWFSLDVQDDSIPVLIGRKLPSPAEYASKSIRLSLVGPGNAISGFGVENSQDSEPDDSYIAFHDDSRNHFIVELTPAEKSRRGVLTSGDAENHAPDRKMEALNENRRRCAVEVEQLYKKTTLDFSRYRSIPPTVQGRSTAGEGWRKNEDIFELHGNKETEISFSQNKSFIFLKLESTSFLNNPLNPDCPASCPEISFFFAEKQLEKLKHDRKSRNRVLFSSANSASSRRLIRRPITKLHREPTSRLPDRCGDDLSDFEKFMVFVKYLPGFRLGVGTGTAPTLMEKIGVCGSDSNALLALAAACRIKGRYANLHTYPENNGHPATEMFLDGKRRLFEPTYGLHFKDTEPGEIMSSDDLPDLDNEVIPIYLNQKRYAASGKQTGRGTPVVFLHVNPAEPTGSVNPMFYPMNLDLNNRLRLMPAAPSCGGANYLETEMANKLKELSGLTAGKEYGVCLVPYSIGRDPGTGEIVFRGPVPGPGIRKENSLNFRLKETNLLPISLHFAAAALEVTPGFPPPYRRPKFYYLSPESVKEIEKKAI